MSGRDMYPEDFDNLFIETMQQYEALERPIQVAWCIHRLEAEVNNGGFYQFFFNSSGRYAHETLEALREIRADRTAELLRTAISICYPDGYPSVAENHEEALSSSTDTMEKIFSVDEAFGEYTDDITSLVNVYLDRNG